MERFQSQFGGHKAGRVLEHQQVGGVEAQCWLVCGEMTILCGVKVRKFQQVREMVMNHQQAVDELFCRFETHLVSFLMLHSQNSPYLSLSKRQVELR